MRLFADRFVINDIGRTVDLATGAPVIVNIAGAGSAPEQLRWTLRCDRWRTLQHNAIAPLLDFGVTPDEQRFEAWVCGPPIVGPLRRTVGRSSDAAARFIEAAAMTIGSDLASGLHESPRGPIVVLDEGSGYPDGKREPIEDALALADRGFAIVPRPAVTALAEAIEHGDRSRVQIAVLWGPGGSGKSAVVRELARIARLNGFVPISSRLLAGPYGGLWQDRSLFVVAEAGPTPAWTAALESTLRSPRPHVVLIVSDIEHRGVDGVGLGPLGADVLCAAVVPVTQNALQVARIKRAATLARGLPGRFVQLLWHRAADEYEGADAPANRRGLRAAETTAEYGGADAAVEPPAVTTRLWPASMELANLRRQLDAARELIGEGRHGPGVRQLRHIIGAMARRDDWSSAADGALTLAACLLRRGRPREAHTALEEARQYASRSGQAPLLVDVAILNGEAWIDLARLDEAESVLAATATSARGLGERSAAARTAVSLARCMYWRGQYAEAAAALAEGTDQGPPANALRADLLAARIAMRHGQFDRATALTAKALGSARADSDGASTAAALYCAGLVRMAIGDLDVAERDLADAITAARAAHDPLRAVRAQLLQVEVERRRGHIGAANARLERIARIVRTLPPIVRARVDLIRALAAEPDATRVTDRIDRQKAATGLGALEIYVGGARQAGQGAEPIEAIAREVVAIVRTCQTADDEAVVLKELCVRVRQQAHAAAIAFVGGELQRYAVLSSDGPRIGSTIGERAVTAGVTVPPHRHDDRVEAAVPILYGGARIGALCARWTLGSPYDVRRAAATLEVVAAAAAPIVSAVLTRREAAVRTGIELLGVTPAMDELRETVERAAAAPFGVLIEGESGSGKELVARAVHRRSARRDRSFCTINCAALPDDLIEAELFGHARGAFTGAVAARAGVFEEAHGGTLFLDEIGELSPRAQAKILRVIQDGDLRRVGENLPRRVDVRIVAATNRDLRREVEAGRFRLDLWYRLDVIHITVPPLRDRREDIPLLAEHFWREAVQRVGSRATLGAGTLAALAHHDWPGNVRQLQNVLAALAVRSPRRGIVPPTALPPPFAVSTREEAWRLTDARRAFEERFIRAALARTGGHRGRAADELGLSRQGLTKLMARLGIAASDDAAADRPGEGSPNAAG